MKHKLLILLGISGIGVGIWWVLKKRPSEPSGIGKGLLPGAGEMPAVGVSPSGQATIGDLVQPVYAGPGSWDVAGQGQVVVPGSGPTAEEKRRACGDSMLHCYYYYVREACADVQRCRDEGIL